MATIYKFDVKCVSPFVALSEKKVSDIIIKALTEYRNDNGLRLESIEVNSKQ